MLLPGVTFAEKTGTFTNTERRIQMVRQAIEPLGEARQDWRITAELAKRMLADGRAHESDGERLTPAGTTPAPSDIMAEISSADAQLCRRHPRPPGARRAPAMAGARSPTIPARPSCTSASSRAAWASSCPSIMSRPPSCPTTNIPMLLSTGRVLYHWHGGEMTRRAEGLMEVYGQALIEVNPDDAATTGV